jgi:hypothetical protein
MYLFHPRYRQTTRAAWSAHHLIRQVQGASRRCLFGKPR